MGRFSRLWIARRGTRCSAMPLPLPARSSRTAAVYAPAQFPLYPSPYLPAFLVPFAVGYPFSFTNLLGSACFTFFLGLHYLVPVAITCVLDTCPPLLYPFMPLHFFLFTCLCCPRDLCMHLPQPPFVTTPGRNPSQAFPSC